MYSSQHKSHSLNWRELRCRAGSLVLNDLSFAYDNSTEVIASLDLELNAPGVVCILGENGIGKTTLFDILTGCVDGWPQGHPLPDTSYMFQDFHSGLIPWLTVQGNLSLPTRTRPDPDINRSRAELFASKCHALETLWSRNKPVRHLSIGQRQLSALLRAFAGDESILILDEPFSSIDFATKLQLARVIHEWVHEHRRLLLASVHVIDDALLLADTLYLAQRSPIAVLKRIDLPSGERNADWLTTDNVSNVRAEVVKALYGNHATHS